MRSGDYSRQRQGYYLISLNLLSLETKNNYQNIQNIKEYVSQTATNMGNNVGFSGKNFMGNNVNPTFQQQPVSNVGIQQPVFNSATLELPPQEQVNDEMPF